MTRTWAGPWTFAAMLALGGCDNLPAIPFLQPDGTSAAPDAAASADGPATIARDVEAPEVFQVTEPGLWDGRPSLGGVWVAHPDVTDPERVIIRNEDNGKSVIGALFRREREIPGPRLQVSSDAAETIGALAGQPVTLKVTALRREEVPVAAPEPETPAAETTPDTPASAGTAAPARPASADIETTELGTAPGRQNRAGSPTDTPVGPPLSALNPQPLPAAGANAAAAAAPAPATRPASSLAKPFLQIGIFSVEENANNTATALRQAGIVPTVRRQSSQGKTFWRVLIGPVTSGAERNTLLRRVRELGFEDAYAVTN